VGGGGRGGEGAGGEGGGAWRGGVRGGRRGGGEEGLVHDIRHIRRRRPDQARNGTPDALGEGVVQRPPGVRVARPESLGDQPLLRVLHRPWSRRWSPSVGRIGSCCLGIWPGAGK